MKIALPKQHVADFDLVDNSYTARQIVEGSLHALDRLAEHDERCDFADEEWRRVSQLTREYFAEVFALSARYLAERMK